MWAAFAFLGEGKEKSPQSTFGMSQPSANPMFGVVQEPCGGWPGSAVLMPHALPEMLLDKAAVTN